MRTSHRLPLRKPALLLPALLAALPFAMADEVKWWPSGGNPNGAAFPDWWDDDHWDPGMPGESDLLTFFIHQDQGTFRTAELTIPDRQTVIDRFRSDTFNNDRYQMYWVGNIRVANGGGPATRPLMGVRLGGAMQIDGITYGLGIRSGRVDIGVANNAGNAWMSGGLWKADAISVSDLAGGLLTHPGGTIVTPHFGVGQRGFYDQGGSGKLFTQNFLVRNYAGKAEISGDLSATKGLRVIYGGFLRVFHGTLDIGAENTSSFLESFEIDPDSRYDQDAGSVTVHQGATSLSGLQYLSGGTFNSPRTGVGSTGGKELLITGDAVANLGQLNIATSSKVRLDENGSLRATSLTMGQGAILDVGGSGKVNADSITLSPQANLKLTSDAGGSGSVTIATAMAINGAEMSSNGPAANIQAPAISVTGGGLAKVSSGGKLKAAGDFITGDAAGGRAEAFDSGSELGGYRIWVGQGAGSSGVAMAANGGTLKATDALILGPLSGTSNASLVVGGDNGAGGFLQAGYVDAPVVLRGGAATNSRIDFRHSSPSYTFDPRIQYIDGIIHSGPGTTNLSGRIWDAGALAVNAGTMQVSHSQTANTADYFGANSGGKLVVSGAILKAPVVAFPRAIFGVTGDGTLSVTNGGRVESSFLLGGAAPAGGTGRLEVSGGASVLVTGSPLNVGFQGHGEVDIKSGGKLYSNHPDHPRTASIGEAAQGLGDVEVGGPGSLWDVGSLVVGNAGAGYLTVEDSASVTCQSLVLGRETSGSGKLVMDSHGRLHTRDHAFYVGNKGRGTVELSGGATLKIGETGQGGMFFSETFGAIGSLQVGYGYEPGVLEARYVGTDSDTMGDVSFLHNSPDYLFKAAISPANIHLPDGNTGRTSLVSPDPSYVADVTISSGTLRVAQGSTLESTGRVVLGDVRQESMIGGAPPVLEADGAETLIKLWNDLEFGGEAVGHLRLKNGGVLELGAAGSRKEIYLGDKTGFGESIVFGGSNARAGHLVASRIHSRKAGNKLVFDHVDANFTFNTTIEGNLTLEKRGTGRTTWATSFGHHVGPLLISSGSFITSSAVGSATPVTVYSGGTFGGSNSVEQITLFPGSTLSPGDGIGTTTVKTLRLNGGNLFRIDLGPGNTCDRIENHNTVPGNPSPPGHQLLFPGTITFEFRNKGMNATGAYPVMTHTTAFSADFMGRLRISADFPLAGVFQQRLVSPAGGVGYHLLEFVASSYKSGYSEWAMSHDLDPASDGDPYADPDQDGLANMVEYMLKSSPVSGTPVNLPTMTLNGSALLFTFITREGVGDYFTTHVQYSTDLTTWIDAPPSMVDIFSSSGRGIITAATIPRPANGKAIFARMSVRPVPY